MSMRYKGGRISATPPTTSTSAASGSWALQSAMQSVAAVAWPRSPAAPTIGTATASGSNAATVTFTAPTDAGTGAVTYTAKSSPSSITGTGTSPITVSGLTASTSYTFTVLGTTPGGTGPSSSASNSITTDANGFIGLLGGGSSGVYNVGIAQDSSGNSYICGSVYNSSTTSVDILTAKFNSSGSLLWQATLGNAVSESYGRGVTVDASGNVYSVGYYYSNGWQIVKYNSSGTLQWQVYLTAGVNGYSANSVAVDSSGNVYACGNINSPSTIGIIKLDSSGSTVWERKLYSGTTGVGTGIALDSSNNVYVTGYYTGGSFPEILIAKYDTSGTIQWQRRVYTSYAYYGTGIAVDSSGNSYISGYYSVTGNSEFYIAKYDTSGTFQWGRNLGDSGAAATDNCYSVAVDSSSNVYVCGYSYDNTLTPPWCIQLAKYDTSGTIQWQRKFYAAYPITGSQQGGFGVKADASGKIYIAATMTGAGFGYYFIAKVPSNGSATGTYSVGGYSITYTTSSLVDYASYSSNGNASLTDSAATNTINTASLNVTGGSLSYSVTTL